MTATPQDPGRALLAVVSRGKQGMIKDGLALIDTARARALIAAGADLRVQDENGVTALGWVCLFGHTELARMLIAAGAPVNLASRPGTTPLMNACWMARREIIDLLIAAQADPRPRDTSGCDAAFYTGNWDGSGHYAKRLAALSRKLTRQENALAAAKSSSFAVPSRKSPPRPSFPR